MLTTSSKNSIMLNSIMLSTIKFSRKLATISTIVVLLASASFGVGYFRTSIAKAITEGRCQAGAFQTHSLNVEKLGADSDTDTPSPGDSTLSTSADAINTSTGKTVGKNLISNAGFEDTYQGKNSTDYLPTDWTNNVFGKDKATFTLVQGRDSDAAARVDLREHSDGDADWYYQPVNVKAGGYYTFTDWYKSNANTRPVLMVKSSDASKAPSYINLKLAPASSSWTKYSVSFFVPVDASQVQVFHPLATTGTLVTDDYSLFETQEKGFSEPLVSLTFDDGWKSIHDQALPLMKKYGVVSTQYLVTGYIGQARDYVTPKDVYDFRNSGHEVASHSVNHLDLAKQPAKIVDYELDQSKKDLSECYAAPTDYAAPYGTYNATTQKAAKANYQTYRSTDVGFNTADNFNPYNLVVQNVDANTTQAQIQGWLTTAKANHAWLILVYHQVDAKSGSYARKPADFEQDLKSIKNSNIAVKTVQAAFAATSSQVK
jgi:peptidoglycan/xylan/chitin deacetylase (PgdA/CDA1 family)